MTGFYFDLSEVQNLAADLSKAGLTASREAQAVVKETADEVQSPAKAAAPVGPTGDLQSGISVKTSGLSAEIGPNVRYASFVELGTRRMAPEPYLFPAAEAARPKFEERMAKVADGILK